MPPSGGSVMLRVWMPKWRAVKACPSSCSTMQPNRVAINARFMPRDAMPPSPELKITHRGSSQNDQCRYTLILNNLAIFKDGNMFNSLYFVGGEVRTLPLP